MKASVRYSRDSLRHLKKLSPDIAKRIVQKISDNATQKDPLSRAKALQGRLSGKYRYRVGDYRVIFSIDEVGNISIIMVLSIKHRREVYK